jgi:hypothetical protein
VHCSNLFIFVFVQKSIPSFATISLVENILNSNRLLTNREEFITEIENATYEYDDTIREKLLTVIHDVFPSFAAGKKRLFDTPHTPPSDSPNHGTSF